MLPLHRAVRPGPERGRNLLKATQQIYGRSWDGSWCLLSPHAERLLSELSTRGAHLNGGPATQETSRGPRSGSAPGTCPTFETHSEKLEGALRRRWVRPGIMLHTCGNLGESPCLLEPG